MIAKNRFPLERVLRKAVAARRTGTGMSFLCIFVDRFTRGSCHGQGPSGPEEQGKPPVGFAIKVSGPAAFSW